MNDLGKQENSPWLSLVILLGLTIVCTILTQLPVVLFGILSPSRDNLGLDFSKNLTFSYALIISGSIGTFLLPAWILQRLEPYHIYFPKKNSQHGILFLLVALFMFSFSPLMEWVGELNRNMSFPESLQSLGDWMREKEDSMAELTKTIVMVDSWNLLFVNLFAIAVVPAIAEEYYFRGAMMQIIQRMVKNQHLTIWITAIIFSAIHVQFFGFIPRMLLGAFFGYMLVWTQNIWVPILGHFINNAAAVLFAFYYTRQGMTYEDLQSYEGYSIFVYLGSFMLSGIIGWYFYKKSKELINGNRLGKN